VGFAHFIDLRLLRLKNLIIQVTVQSNIPIFHFLEVFIEISENRQKLLNFLNVQLAVVFKGSFQGFLKNVLRGDKFVIHLRFYYPFEQLVELTPIHVSVKIGVFMDNI
jgi:hypothetical protein